MAAERSNDRTYRTVTESGLGVVYCLGFEVYCRWSRQCIELLPKLALARAKCLHPRLRRGTAMAYLHRWAGLVSIAVQKAVAVAALRGEGADLASTLL